MAYPVIYLTGAPASGKSTLARALAVKCPTLRVFAYSEELRKYVGGRTATAISEDHVRKESGRLVTAQDVQELDQLLVAEAQELRKSRPMLIDSHPVTKEHYGFRITGFDVETLRRLAPDFIVCLYTTPEVTRQRIEHNAMGRPQVSTFEAHTHTELQCSVAAQYGVLLGKPVYLFDSSVPQDELLDLVAEKTGLDMSYAS